MNSIKIKLNSIKNKSNSKISWFFNLESSAHFLSLVWVETFQTEHRNPFFLSNERYLCFSFFSDTLKP